MRNSPSLPPVLLGSGNGNLPRGCLESSSWSLLGANIASHWHTPSLELCSCFADRTKCSPTWMTQLAPSLFGSLQNPHRPKSFASTVRFHLFIFYSFQRQAGNCHWSMSHAGIFPLPFPIWMWLPWKIPRWTGASPMQSWPRGHWLWLMEGSTCSTAEPQSLGTLPRAYPGPSRPYSENSFCFWQASSFLP